MMQYCQENIYEHVRNLILVDKEGTDEEIKIPLVEISLTLLLAVVILVVWSLSFDHTVFSSTKAGTKRRM